MENSPFIYQDPVIPPIFAGRRTELAYINKALYEYKESLVIYGNDAIGKSSIISTIYTNIKEADKSRVFPVGINAFDFINAVEENFLGIATHQICASIWTKLLKRKYSELIETSIANTHADIFKSEEEKTIQRIFKIVTSEKITGTGILSREFGAEFYLKGSRSQSIEIVNERKSLAPFEFLHLLEEMIDIIRNYGFMSIIVFCDELNHLPEKTNTEILRNYFNIFSSNKIQFVIVVVNPEQKGKKDAEKLIESFNCKLEIKHFQSKESIEELINNTLKNSDNEIGFSSSCIDFLFEKTEGHPWWIQKICDLSYLNATPNEVIALESIEESYKVFEKEIEVYKQRIAQGLPFRKYNLNF